MRKVIVVGAGMGGLSTALRLRYKGYQVQIYEKLARPGGRSNLILENGFRVDTGPTILVMKESFEEFYKAIGEDINKRITFTHLDPNYRIYYHDGTHIDLYNSMANLASEVTKVHPDAAEWLFKFLGDSAQKYELGMAFVDRNYDHITDLANPSALVKLLRTKAHQNLFRQVSRYFRGNDKLTKAFSFHSMFLGLSPLDALAMYSLITYADMALGMWYPKGGIYSIIEDMVSLCEKMDIQIHTNSPVSQILTKDGHAYGIRLESGEKIISDIVISNADLPYSYHSLLSESPYSQRMNRRLKKMEYACSGFLLYLGIDRLYPEMRHQSLYFSENYRKNLSNIFKLQTIPEDPSFHLNNPTITDPYLAPEGHSLLYVLAPMPNLEHPIEWKENSSYLRDILLNKLEKIVDPDIRRHIVWEKIYTPTDYQADFNAWYGTAFGSLSQGFFQSAYFRPHNNLATIKNLYFVGQGTYPGIGMPMVLISSKLVAERIGDG